MHRIRALKDFGGVNAGDIGGWIEKEKNLSHESTCWVYDEAFVYGEAKVCGKAVVREQSDYITISPIGSRNGTTTAFRTAKGARIKCGCFYGSISEFEAKVKETHKDNQYAKEYLALAELLKIRFGE